MVKTRCYKCVHKEICNYRTEYDNAVSAVCNVSYEKNNSLREVIENSAITFVAECPHFYKRGEQICD